MATIKINISLPDPLKDFVDEQVSERRLSSASDYVGELIREEQKRRAKEKLEELLLEGLNSGPAIEVDDDFWRERRADLLARHAESQARRSRPG